MMGLPRRCYFVIGADDKNDRFLGPFYPLPTRACLSGHHRRSHAPSHRGALTLKRPTIRSFGAVLIIKEPTQ